MFVVLQPEDEPKVVHGSAGREPAALGEDVFAANCASCHTLDAAGATGKVGPNLDEARPDEALVRERVTAGKGGMPSFKGTLDDDEIAAVAAYVSSSAGQQR
jgi:mono/diheme cytochrome c family protein